MKYVDEYRDPQAAAGTLAAIDKLVTRPWSVMEICGGQTHAIVKYGIDQMLPEPVTLVHGPGCPVCVTPVGLIDQAIELSQRDDVILVSFGDMARVPGSAANLLSAKAGGADLRLVYSPLDALPIARDNPDKQVVFFAVGFETTAPATAMAARLAQTEEIENFSMLVSHVLVPPAMQAILSSPDCSIDGFLAAGHVCTVMGIDEYPPIAAQYQVPIVVTGFEPLDILQGLLMCLQQLESGTAQVQNQYARAVRTTGNPTAQQLIAEVFEVVPRHWRGVGEIDHSGLAFAPAYAGLDAQRRFALQASEASGPSEIHCGQVLQGIIKPMQCPNFGGACTPRSPLGAPMVSSEGACAAYFQHRGREQIGQPIVTQHALRPADTA